MNAAARPIPPATASDAGGARWSEAHRAAMLVALDPVGIGGAIVQGGPSPARDRWLDLVRAASPAGAPVIRVPAHVTTERLLGGLDLAATLGSGRPAYAAGLLAAADGGLVVLAMAERAERATLAPIAAALDAHEVRAERDGASLRHAARFGVIALDESREDEAPPATLLADRLALRVDLRGIRKLDEITTLSRDAMASARERLAAVTVDPRAIEAICGAAAAFGVDSMRAPILTLAVARAFAALEGHDAVEEADLVAAVRLVIAPRATQLPSPPESAEEEQPQEEPPPPPPDATDAEAQTNDDELPIDADLLIEAARAAIPRDLLERLGAAATAPSRERGTGEGPRKPATERGRPIGTRRGRPGGGVRLSLVETLRAAAPWQRLRRGEAFGQPGGRIAIRPDDFRVMRHEARTVTTIVFVVDASGSSAFHRLAEAKGAVELLLADCYARRDQVALIAFRGRAAELLLAPTRSLVRAKRSLAGLPGGGTTPLAAGLDAAAALGRAVAGRGAVPIVVLLTDGRGNVARSGAIDRTAAETDALAAGRALARDRIDAILLDTSPQPQPRAERLAQAMGARYVPLPYADASTISQAVRRIDRAPARAA